MPVSFATPQIDKVTSKRLSIADDGTVSGIGAGLVAAPHYPQTYSKKASNPEKNNNELRLLRQ